jgi:two-component system, NtrC family, sensor kinase
MKLLPKFALLSFGVSAVPLAIAGLSSTRISQQALRESIQEQEQMVAVNVSGYVVNHLGHFVDILRAFARAMPTALASPDLLPKFLQLVYHQNDDFSAVIAIDEHGKRLGTAFQERPLPNSLLGAHEAVALKDIDTLEKMVPVYEVLKNGTAIGPVFPAGPRGNAHTLVAVKYEPRKEDPAILLVAMVSLRRIHDHIATLAVDERDIFLLDRESRVVASGRAVGAPTFAPKQLPRSMAGTLPDQQQILTYTSGGEAVFGAYARIPELLMGVVVERPEREALSPVRRLRLTTIFWMGVSGFVAAVIGAALARSLAMRAGALVHGARQIAQGRLNTELEVHSNDELGELAKAFNAMTTSLDAARTEILRQTEEITTWNETLEKRVEQKTKELRDTQDLLLRSRSLAAIGSLGAGVAHEINNPLAGILGLAQLLLADLPNDHPATPLIKDVEDQAQRIQSIVGNLLRLAQRQAGEDYRTLDIARIIDDALELCGANTFRDAGITIDKRVVSPSPPVRGSAPQLQAALMNLIQNARGAMENGGTLFLETSMPGERLLRLRITDTGRGINPEHLSRIFDPFFTTKARRADTGIGLSVVHKIIEDHGGSITVESEPGHGTTFWITLPVTAGSTHLA